jgi:hypothetical protein
VANLFKSPNRLEDIGSVISRLESGDLKLRVRALEAERALTRVQVRVGPTALAGGKGGRRRATAAAASAPVCARARLVTWPMSSSRVV